MATTRIKDITTAASTFSSDDFVAIDGATSGTRKMAKADLISEVSSGVSGTYLEESNNLSDVASLDTSKLNMEIPDVGSAGNQVPLNSMLSSMAYQDSAAISVGRAEIESTTGTATTQALTVTDGSSTNFVVQEDGSVGVGTASPSSYYSASDDLVIAGASNRGISIISGATSSSSIAFGSGTGTDAYRGKITYDNNAHSLSFNTLSATRATINSDGDLGLGVTPVHDANRTQLILNATWGGKIVNKFGGSDSSAWYANTSNYTYFGTAVPKPLILQTDGTERINIDQYGALNIKSVGGVSAAQFPSGISVNGITALPSATGTPFIVGRDTGSLRSAHFAGNLKFDSGYGIDFGSAATSAGDGTGTTGTPANSVLSDYEFGSWIPEFRMSSTNFAALTMDVIAAQYVKIGRHVHCQAFIRTDNVDTTGAGGYLIINGLPFVSDTTASNYAGLTIHNSVSWTNAPTTGYVAPNSALIYLNRNGTTGTVVLTASDVVNGAVANQNEIIFTVSYIAST